MHIIAPATPPGSRVWRVIHFPLVLLAIGIVFILGAAALSNVVTRALGHPRPAWEEVPVAIVVAGLFVGAYWLFERLIEKRPMVEFGRARWAGELGTGLGIGFVLFSIVVAVIAAFGGYHVVGTNGVGVLNKMVALGITSAVVEELLFRAVFFRLVESWLGSWIALALSAALFGAAHLLNPNASPLAAVSIMLEAGIMLGAVYMVTRRLWAAIGVHAAWNFTQGGIYGISVSGMNEAGLLRPRMSGPDLLTGGAFGAEASLPAILVCTAFGIAVLVYARRHDRIVAPFWQRRTDQAAGLQA